MAQVIQIDNKVYLNVKLYYDIWGNANGGFEVIKVTDNQYTLRLPLAEYVVIVDKKELHRKFKKKGQ